MRGNGGRKWEEEIQGLERSENGKMCYIHDEIVKG